jgi:hypothetical protein
MKMQLKINRENIPYRLTRLGDKSRGGKVDSEAIFIKVWLTAKIPARVAKVILTREY